MYTCIHLTLHVYNEIMTSCDEQGEIVSVAMTTIQEGIAKRTGKTYCIIGSLPFYFL